MKSTLRPLLSILFLMVVVVALTVRVSLRRGFIQLRNDSPLLGIADVPQWNQTLLNYASIDVSDPGLKKEVEALLEGNFWSLGRLRTILSAARYRLQLGARSTRELLVQVRSPEFSPVWFSFRRLLSSWFQNRRFESDVMVDLVNLVQDFVDENTGKKMGAGRKYKSCAVVGNSGILLKSEYGALIDSHEAVIRLNNALISGFEANVGNKSTISFMNSNILHSCAQRLDCYCHPYGVDVPIVMYICQPGHFFDYIACNSSERAPLIVTDPRFDVLCTRIVKYYSLKRFCETTGKDQEQWVPIHDGPYFHYSSGMQAVMLAVGVCDKVSIFGFGKSNATKHHYHTNQRSELNSHDYEAEYDLYHDLVARPRAIPFISDKFKFPSVVMYQ